jgi:hypothetical protein
VPAAAAVLALRKAELKLQVSQLNDRLRFGPEEAVELIADDPLLVHLEQRHAAAGGKIS